MPNVDGKRFPYTKAGMKAAAQQKKKIRPGVPKPAKKLKPFKRTQPTNNSVTAQRPGNETLYNMDFNKMYSEAAKRGMRKKQPMPGLTRRYIGRSNRVST